MKYERKIMEIPERKKGEEVFEKDRLKESIINMVTRMNNKDYLFKIYHYILAKYRRDRGQAGD